MKKKIYKVFIILIIVIIFIIGGLIIFYKQNGKIFSYKDIKQAINEENNITTIDVTEIELGKEKEHEHVYKTIYNEEKHWEECIICNERRNEVVHSFKTTWMNGSESCYFTNSYTKTCVCGYSETGHKPCVWNGKSYGSSGYFYHWKICSVCKNGITDPYYLGSYGNGKLYSVKEEKEKLNDRIEQEAHYSCVLANGTIITCNNLGKCNICGKSYTSPGNDIANLIPGKLVCKICNTEFGTYTSEVINDSSFPTTATITTKISLTNGATWKSIGEGLYNGAGIWSTANCTVKEINSDKTEITIMSKGKFKSTTKEKLEASSWNYVNINGTQCRLGIIGHYSPDLIEPAISHIDTGDIDIWHKNRTINISGTENWTNTVEVKILDDEENIVYTGNTVVNNGSYSISCTPDVEAGLEGRTFKVIVTDACENSTEQEFTISKIDAIPPEATPNAEVGGEWAKEKSFTAIASDHGIGNVQIAFNDVSDYQLATKNGTEYTREYKLVGDVYSPTKARIFYKDELNNISTQEITIDKIDNTAPTITSSRFDNNKLIIEASDIKEEMGEGSGVAKYRFITSNTQYENPVVPNADSTEVLVGEDMTIPNISEIKYVYVVAEDAVGNTSKIYEVEVPQLELTSKVNVTVANEKGAIELDWSSYDTNNKYFVIYCKQEEEKEWKTIVSLDEKFNGNSYTDNLANDKNSPIMTSINIEENLENNSINLTTTAVENGTRYLYYIEAYDVKNVSLLNVSNKIII